MTTAKPTRRGVIASTLGAAGMASLPGRGDLSSRLLNVDLGEKNDRKYIKQMEASDDVLFKGTLPEKGEPKPEWAHLRR